MSRSAIFPAVVNVQGNHEGAGHNWDAFMTFIGEHIGLVTLITVVVVGVICCRTYYRFKETYEINLLIQGVILIISGSIGTRFPGAAELILWLGAFIALAAYDAPKCGVKNAIKGLLLAPIMIGYIAFILAIPAIIGFSASILPPIIADGLRRQG